MINNLLIENVTIFEIMNGINTGLYQYNELHNLRIVSEKNPNYVILATDANVGEVIYDFVEKDVEVKKFPGNKVLLDTEVLDYIIINRDLQAESGTYKLSTMSVLEIIVASRTLENFNGFDINSTDFKCYEINYVEPESELPTDMNILG